MSENRTILGAIKEYRKGWGIILGSLHINEMIKLFIESYLPIDPLPGHGLSLILILVLWAVSDKYSITKDEDARIIK